MTLEVSSLSSFNGVVPLIDSAVLLALDSDLLMIGSWSSCLKTPGGTVTRLELRLANS
jgi:hypothetical protein